MSKKQKIAPFTFEHKSKPLLPIGRFIHRLLHYGLYSLMLLIISLGMGTLGYHYFIKIPWIDSFYNASLILTGMGPVDPMPTNGAKLFASFYALFSGIAFLTTAAVFFTPIAHRLLHNLHLNDNEISN